MNHTGAGPMPTQYFKLACNPRVPTETRESRPHPIRVPLRYGRQKHLTFVAEPKTKGRHGGT
jgi:hypothetical protein